MTAVDSLKAFERTLTSYDRLYRKYREAYAAHKATDVRSTLRKMEKMRPGIAEQYGEVRVAIIETLGGVPTIATGYRNFGDAFAIVLSDPLEEPFLETALEGAIRSVQMAIGKHRAEATTHNTPAGASSGRELALHPVIEGAAGKLFADGYYPQATFEASKALLHLLSMKTGIKKEHMALVEEALSVKNPRLLFNANETDADHDEQRGIFHLAEGVVLAVRHQGAHVADRREERDRALELLGLISYLAFRIDGASVAPQKADKSGSSRADPRSDPGGAAAARRSACRLEIAQTVRNALDRHLGVYRLDAVGRGEFVTIRHIAAGSRNVRLKAFIDFGAPAMAIAEVVDELRSSLQTDIAPCYGKLRLPEQTLVDEFAAALKDLAAAARVMTEVPMGPVETREARMQSLADDVAEKVQAVEATGDALDSSFDEAGFHAAATARANSAEERQRVAGHGAALLLKNARDASYALGSMSVQMPIPTTHDLTDLVNRLTRAREIVLEEVDAEAFREAPPEAQAAHRRIAYEDIFDSHNTAVRLLRGEVDPEGEARMRERLARFPSDIAALEAIRDRPLSHESRSEAGQADAIAAS
jgi:uncharacterized protein (TIGR02391 family)